MPKRTAIAGDAARGLAALRPGRRPVGADKPSRLKSPTPRAWLAGLVALLLGAVLAAPVAETRAQTSAPAPAQTEAAPSEAWTADLIDGRKVRIDPFTNRPTVKVNGEEVQLWDGIHRLEGGAELTVIDGRVVPSKSMARERGIAPGPASAPTAGQPAKPERAAVDLAPCRQLVEQSCGIDEDCFGQEKCSAARQLADMAQEQFNIAPGGPAARDMVAKCREALVDDFFAPCHADPRPERP